MKRVVLFILAVGALAPFAAPTAGAAVPCRDRIYNDWYHDGKIATTYPTACYRDALAHVKGDALVYSSLSDDIRAAMQGALAVKKGDTKVPAQIGTHGTRPLSSSKPKQTMSPHDPSSSPEQVDSTLPTSTVAAGTTSGSGSGIPVPLLVLGGLALLLTAVGGVGVIAKRRRL
ncbi:MAG TPA: hypothetical protein VLJ44_11415 [Gaiellaceae bacterium]|nr:hypothetical protein [Gaiellaceae bacterium]